MKIIKFVNRIAIGIYLLNDSLINGKYILILFSILLFLDALDIINNKNNIQHETESN